jgi:hypothetical protein
MSSPSASGEEAIMKRIAMTRAPGAALLLLAALPAPALLSAQQAQQNDIAVVYRLMLDKRLEWNAAGNLAPLGQRLAQEDVVVTSANTRAMIRFTDDGTTVRLDPSSRLLIAGPGVDRNTLVKTVNLELGDLFASVTRQGARNFQVRTPAGVAAVKGTEFVVRVAADQTTTIITLDGVVEFFNDAGTVDVDAGNTLQVATVTTQPVPRETVESDLVEVSALVASPTTEALEDRVEVEIKVHDAEGREKTITIEMPRSEARALLGGGL